MANHRKLSPQQEQRVVTLYRDDKQSIMYIARELKVSDDVVYFALKRAGVELRPRGIGGLRSTSRLKADQAVALYVSGVGCEEVAKKFGVTMTTVTRWVRASGYEVRPKGFQQGADHPGWNGGRITGPGGYIQVLLRRGDQFFEMGQHRNEPDTHRYVFEHRLVMAHQLGRALLPGETVHHLDGDRSNNKPSNLQLRQGKHGKGSSFCCADCGSYNVIPAVLN